MSSCVVIGAQWGDEGKGKLVDLFTEQADLVVRYQGGNNAGHTLVVDTGNGPVKRVVHLIPSGILHPGKTCLIASGVVVDLDVLFREIDQLQQSNINVAPGRLLVSLDAHVIMPFHREIDKAREARLEERRIGTTGRGIGPAYEDRTARRGVRTRDLLDEKRLRARLETVLDERNAVLAWMGAPTFAMDALVDVECEESPTFITRFANYLRLILPCNNVATMIMAAKVLGHLAQAGGTLTADFVEFETKRALESLNAEKRSEHHRLAAVLVCKELASNAPTLFFMHVPSYVKAVWAAIHDPKQLIREAAIDSLRATLGIIGTRSQKYTSK